MFTFKKFEKEIIAHARKSKPDIIHAHTPFRVGLPALRAARKIGIPFVYEVRGMCEDSAVAQGRWSPKSMPYRYYRSQENKLIKNADEVIVIGQNLMNEIVGRNLRVGRTDDDSGTSFMRGNIAIVMVYNKSLSDAEITQNFNAQRYRFGR